MKIPLFDIDWTLIKGNNPIHHKAFFYAFKEVYGVTVSLTEKSIEGQIDNEIILDFLRRYGLKDKDIKNKIREATKLMADYFLDHSHKTNYVLMPGTKELLKVLRDKNVPCGALTGNVEKIGWEKLRKAEIKDFFSFGAFGDQGFTRVELIKIAVNRAKKTLKNKKLSKKDFILVGDSLLDVACAKKGGIQIIAVASKPQKKRALKLAGANYVVSSLEEKKTVIEILQKNNS